MSEQNVREIQLGGKQLVFLFMASVVLAVAIFLLGISVGRGVGTATAGAPAEVAEPAPVAEMPPPTEVTSKDLVFHDKLQDQTPPKAQAQPPADTEKPAAPAPTDTTSVPVTPPASASATSTKPVPPPAAAPPPAQSTAKPAAAGRTQASGAGYYVQVNAFRSKENADRQAGQLKAKGHAALVQADAGSLFRVRIGPFQDRADAAKTVERLQREDGIRASVGP